MAPHGTTQIGEPLSQTTELERIACIAGLIVCMMNIVTLHTLLSARFKLETHQNQNKDNLLCKTQCEPVLLYIFI